MMASENYFARVVKLVDTRDLKSLAARHTGSIPVPGTTNTLSHKGYFLIKQKNTDHGVQKWQVGEGVPGARDSTCTWGGRTNEVN